MKPASPAPARQFRGSYARRMVLVLLPLILLPFILIWVTELSQEYVDGQVNSRLPFTLLLMGASLLLLALLLAISTRRLVRPLLELDEAIQRFAQGRWELRLPVERNDEIGRLAASFNQMADDLTSLYHALESKVEISSRQIRTTAAMAEIASTSPSLEALLRRSSELIREHFDLASVRVYLLDVRGQPVLAENSQPPAVQSSPARAPSALVQSAIAQNKHRLEVYPASEPAAAALGAEASLPVRAEAALPIAIGSQVFGALELQANLRSAFSPEVLNELQALTHSFAVAIQNFHLLEAAQVSLQEANTLFRASSQIAHANSPEEVFSLVEQALRHSPYLFAILTAVPDGLRLTAMGGPQLKSPIITNTMLPVQSEALKAQFPDPNPVIIQEMENVTGLLARLASTPRQMGSRVVALLPVVCHGELAAIYTFGADEKYAFTPTTLQPYVTLAEFTGTVLEKLQVMDMMEKRVRALQTLESLGQAISTDTDLGGLYRLIHEKIIEVMGQVEFLIALYDPATEQIEVPYAYEGNEPVNFPSFPLGNGLTSIVIRNRQPLLLNQDVAARSAELGAHVVVGAEARSWLGVPLLLSGEAIGALVVQDIQQEKRFSEEDQRLLSTMASQVAVVIRNVHLLASARQQAERERLLYDVTSQIRRSADMHAILESTASELGRLLGIRRARISLGVRPGADDDEPDTPQHLGSVL
jgi:GAF domain-containing protein/HAMP domain-containing protein